MDVKTSFFEVMSEGQKYLKDVSAGKGKFLEDPRHKKFVRNLM
jgi:hypothetical protein